MYTYSCETTSGVVCPLLLFPVQERHWYIGANSVEGHQAGQMAGAHGICEKTEH